MQGGRESSLLFQQTDRSVVSTSLGKMIGINLQYSAVFFSELPWWKGQQYPGTETEKKKKKITPLN